MWAGGFAARPHPSSHLPLLSPQSGESRGQGDEWGCSRKGKRFSARTTTVKFRLSHRLALAVNFYRQRVMSVAEQLHALIGYANVFIDFNLAFLVDCDTIVTVEQAHDDH